MWEYLNIAAISSGLGKHNEDCILIHSRNPCKVVFYVFKKFELNSTYRLICNLLS